MLGFIFTVIAKKKVTVAFLVSMIHCSEKLFSGYLLRYLTLSQEGSWEEKGGEIIQYRYFTLILQFTATLCLDQMFFVIYLFL